MPGVLERLAPGALAERHVGRLAEALLPELGTGIAGAAPAIGELLRDRRRARGIRRAAGRSRRRRRAPPHPHRRRRPRRRCRPARCAHRRRPSSTVCEPFSAASKRADRRALGAAEVGRQDVAVEPERGRDAGRRWSCRRRPGLIGGEVQRRRRSVGPGPARQARCLDAERRGVLVVPGHRAGALAPAGADESGDFRPVQSAVRHVAGSRENAASHVWQPNLRDNTF